MKTCDYCDKDSVVEVNGFKGCVDHIDDAMAGATEGLRLARKELGL